MNNLFRRYLPLLALFLLFCQALHAQAYHPMIVSDSVVWNIFYAGEDHGDYYEYQYRMAGDTMIHGYTYKKLYEYRGFGDLSPAGFTRESGKYIYYRTSLGSGKDTELIAYDFNLQVGDTFIRVDQRRNSKCPIILQTIDSVVLSNGEYRKRYNFKDSCYGPPTYWIEGIGSSRGPFDFSNVVAGFIYDELTCYFLNHELLWSNGNDLRWFCNKDFSIADKQRPKPLNIYPNPANGIIHIDGLPPNARESCYEVINMNGQIVQQGELFINTYLDISGLNKGAYKLEILTGVTKYNAGFIKD